MNRRDFLTKARGQRKAFQEKKNSVRRTARTLNTSLNPYTGWSTDPGAAAHLLRRTLFGAPPSDINYFKSLSLTTAVDEILSFTADPPPVPPENYWTAAYFQELETDLANGIIPAWLQVVPAPPVNDYAFTNDACGGIAVDNSVPKGMPWVCSSLSNFQGPDSNDGYANFTGCGWSRLNSFWAWWGRLIMEQDSNIREKMTLFWHNHFAMRGIGNDPAHFEKSARYWNSALLRYHALGNFKTLVKDITLDPHMIYYLDTDINSVNGYNENYAREMQELFTLGLKPALVDDGSSYTEDDVNNLKRLLTGWGVQSSIPGLPIASSYREAVYFENGHDTEDKQFSSFYNNTTIPGQSGPDGGETELDAFIDLLFNTRGLEIGKHLAREIYRFFVRPSFNYDPQSATNDTEDAQIEQDIIVPLANDFVAANYEIRPMMEKLLKSEHFFSECVRGAMIKSPIDFSAGLCREFSIFPAEYYAYSDYPNSFPFQDINAEAVAYRGTIWTMVSGIGQNIDNPVNVWGWDAYYQTPFDNNWVNGAIFARRINMLNIYTNPKPHNISYYNLGSGSNCGVDAPNDWWFTKEIDFIDFIHTHCSNPGDDQVLIDEAVMIFLPVPIHSSVKDSVKAVLVEGLPDGYTWAYTWSLLMSDPADTDNINLVTQRLRSFFRALFTLEEYHLM